MPTLCLRSVRLYARSADFKKKAKKLDQGKLFETRPKTVLKNDQDVKDVQTISYTSSQSEKREVSSIVNERRFASSVDFTRILMTSEASHFNSERNARNKTIRRNRKTLNIEEWDFDQLDNMQSLQKISPRKIYRGGGYFTALAIYDDNANIDKVSVGETRLGILDSVLNQRERITDARMKNPPKIQTDSSIELKSKMPQELICSRIANERTKSKITTRIEKKCMSCKTTQKSSKVSPPVKQIKLFLSLDV
eukprot:Seg11296.1 transcript_id=Seg11296.1/GoldUCD/mRNA.D3Y31 product="hypothetical protein" protein_id=Seg11296.1/GoldUCD/D3Y31